MTLLYAFPLVDLIQPTLDRGHQEGLSLILVASCWPAKTWFMGIMALLSGTLVSVGLRSERENLMAAGLPINVVATIQSTRVPSTRGLYTLKWHMFVDWCEGKCL